MDRNKTILVISPQPWGMLHISKHHYAIELATQGFRVFFLEPPSANLQNPVEIEATGYDNLSRVRFRFSNSLILRYKARPLYEFLLNRKLKKVLAKLGPIDITWCFESNVYRDLRKFNSGYSILHMVDPVGASQRALFNSADIIFGVSDWICNTIRKYCSKPVYFVNHGLGKDYVAIRVLAAEQQRDPESKKAITVGFIGNLLRSPVDHDAIIQVIRRHPEVNFYFWGPYDGSGNLGNDGTREIKDFINFLAGRPNVKLFGKSRPAQIIMQSAAVDMMFLAYREIPGFYDNSNSHKILEYLAIGKMVLTSYIDQYRETDPQIVRMVKSGDAGGFATQFEELLPQLQQLNSPCLVQRRREIALENTYALQLQRIRSFCSLHNLGI